MEQSSARPCPAHHSRCTCCCRHPSSRHPAGLAGGRGSSRMRWWQQPTVCPLAATCWLPRPQPLHSSPCPGPHLDVVKHNGLAAHALEGAHGGVDAAGQQVLSLLEDLQAGRQCSVERGVKQVAAAVGARQWRRRQLHFNHARCPARPRPGCPEPHGVLPCPAQCVARTSSERLVLSLVVVGAAAARTDTLLRLRGAATAFWARVLAAATLLLRACMVCVHCALMRVPPGSKRPLGDDRKGLGQGRREPDRSPYPTAGIGCSSKPCPACQRSLRPIEPCNGLARSGRLPAHIQSTCQAARGEDRARWLPPPPPPPQLPPPLAPGADSLDEQITGTWYKNRFGGKNEIIAGFENCEAADKAEKQASGFGCGVWGASDRRALRCSWPVVPTQASSSCCSCLQGEECRRGSHGSR